MGNTRGYLNERSFCRYTYRKLRYPFLLLILLFLNAAIANAQGIVDGFLRGKGNADFALSLSNEYSNKFYAGTEKIDLRRNIFSISLYSSYGLHKNIDVLFNVPFINGRLQDGSIFLKYRPVNFNVGPGELSILLAGGFSVPLSDYPTETASAIGQQATAVHSSGLVQMKWNNGLFINVQSGYHYSIEPVPPSVPLSVKAGLAKSRIYWDVWWDYQYGIGGKDYRGMGELAPSSFRELGVSWNRIGGTFYYAFKSNFGSFLSGAYVLDGRNTAAAARISAGIVYKAAKREQ